MPKKRHSNLYTKPPSTAHRSLSSAVAGSSALTRSDDSPKVTGLLNALRSSNVSSSGQRMAPVIAPSMPSEIRQILDLPDTPVPRPRTRRRIDAEGRTLPAGPAPPHSWLESSQWVPVRNSTPQNSIGRNRSELESLGGVGHFPATSSLMATCLRHMARNWTFQRDYNCNYLATLPTQVRSILLSYIAMYGPEEGVGYGGLKSIIFPQAGNFDDFCGNDDFERLDLSGSIGRSIYFKQLQELIAPSRTGEDNEESWDIAVQTIPKSPATPLQFLKMLSLANPSHAISWAKFLNFATSIPTITHLSLANWPTPSLTPNSTTTTMSSRYIRPFQYGGTNFYSHTLDSDWSEAAAVLRRLSTALYSLQYLDLSGCDEWSPALRSSPGIDWKEQWGAMRIIKMYSLMTLSKEEATKRAILRYKCAILNSLELEKYIRRQRGWIVVEHDEWQRYDGFWSEGWSTGLTLGNGEPGRRHLEEAYEAARMGRGAGAGAGAEVEVEVVVVGQDGGGRVGGFWD